MKEARVNYHKGAFNVNVFNCNMKVKNIGKGLTLEEANAQANHYNNIMEDRLRFMHTVVARQKERGITV